MQTKELIAYLQELVKRNPSIEYVEVMLNPNTNMDIEHPGIELTSIEYLEDEPNFDACVQLR